MNNSHTLEIIGEEFKKARDAKNLTSYELANHLCLSTKHIEQIEKGSESAFFSYTHKVQVAKKIAKYLNMPEDIAFHERLSSNNVVDGIESTAKFDVHDISSDAIDHFEKVNMKNSTFDLSKKMKIILTLGFIGIALIFSLIYSEQIWTSSSSSNQFVPQEKNLIVKDEVPNSDEPVHESSFEKNPCDMVTELVPAFRAITPNFAGNYIYMINKNQKDPQYICVIDSKKMKQKITLNPGERKTIIGRPPFNVLSTDFSHVNIYYQGLQVPYPKSGMHTVLVEEVPLSLPVQEIDKREEVIIKEDHSLK